MCHCRGVPSVFFRLPPGHCRIKRLINVAILNDENGFSDKVLKYLIIIISSN